jgi:hypothetical protein
LNADLYTFERLLDYELNQSMRHRRYMSVVLFSLKNVRQELVLLLQNDVRKSDEVFFYKDHFVVLMGKTSKSQAICAVNRYGAGLEVCLDMRCSICSFPEDGTSARELLNVLHQRLKKALELESGSLIAHYG